MTELLQGGRREGTGLGYLEVLQQRTGSWEHQKIYVVVLSRSVMSDSLPPHGLQQASLPCSSLSPGAYSNSCPLTR